MARYTMTPARRAALRKAQIASARKRRKGFRGKASTFSRTTGPKRKANKTLRKFGVAKARRTNKSARLSRRARTAQVRSTALRNKSARLSSKSKKLRAKSVRVASGKQMPFGKKLKGAPARFKKRRAAAKAHVARYRGY